MVSTSSTSGKDPAEGGPIRPYGDTTGDGMVQLSFTLPMPHSKVAEGAASCIFLVRNGVAITSTVTSGILESITRQTVLRLWSEILGMPTLEREIDRTELYVADEVFFCGTGAEITPVRAIDGYTIGNGAIGPLTAPSKLKVLNELYSAWKLPVKSSVGLLVIKLIAPPLVLRP